MELGLRLLVGECVLGVISVSWLRFNHHGKDTCKVWTAR